ncbi:MAG: outer membrane protein assembly factor BamB [Pseudomonadota bacterium]
MTPTLRGGLVLLMTTLLLGGCSWFSWLPWVDKKEDLTKPAELVRFDAEVDIKREWRASIGKGLGKKYLRLSPALLADTILAADGYGHVEARNRFDGKRVWQRDTHVLDSGFFSRLNFFDRRDPSFVAGGVGVGAGMVLLGTTFGEVVALNAADGTDAWRVDVGSEVLSVPVAAGGQVFAQTIDGRLVALDDETGDLTWRFDNQLPVLTLRGTSSPVIADDIVYAGFASGKLSALRVANGEPIWEQRVMLPEGRSELERMVDVDARPLVIGPAIYAGAFQGRVKAYSRRDGRPQWEREYSTFLDLAEGYEQVYVIDEDDRVIALDRGTGEEVWALDSFARRKLSAPIAFSNYLAFGDSEGYLHVVAQRDGRMVGRRKLDGDGIRSNMVYADGTLYVLGNSGSLQALRVVRK